MPVFFQLSQAPVHYSFGETIILMAQQKTNGKSLRFLSFFFIPGEESERAGPGKCVRDGAEMDTLTVGVLRMVSMLIGGESFPEVDRASSTDAEWWRLRRGQEVWRRKKKLKWMDFQGNVDESEGGPGRI